MAVTCAVLDLQAGQRIDLEGDMYADPETYAADGDTSDSQHPEFQYAFEVVLNVVRESDDCIRVDFESGFSCGFPSDYSLEVDPEQ